MSIIGVIQARQESTRLPGKTLAPIGSQTLFDRLLSRLRGSRVSEWWLAIPDRPADDELERIGRDRGLKVFRGDTEDVLSRFLGILEITQADWILRATADNPMVDAELVDQIVEKAGGPFDILGKAPDAGLPLGYFVELARGSALAELWKKIPEDKPYHKLHVTSYLYEVGRKAEFSPPASWPRRQAWRWTVDTAEDLAMMNALADRLGDRWSSASYTEIVDLLDEHPEILQLNSTIAQKAIIEG